MRPLLIFILVLLMPQGVSAAITLCDRDDIAFFGVEGGDQIFKSIKIGNHYHGTTVAKAYEQGEGGPTWLIGGNCPLDPQLMQGLFVSEEAAASATSDLFLDLASGEPKAYANGYEGLLENGAVRASLVFDTMNCVCDKSRGLKE